MSFNSIHTEYLVPAKFSRGGTLYAKLDDAFAISSMLLFQPRTDLMGHSLYDDIQILVGYVRSDGTLSRSTSLIGYAHAGEGRVTAWLKVRLSRLNGETAYRIIRAINRAKAAQFWGDANLWQDAARFNFKPTLSAYAQEQLVAGTGPVQYANRMGGPNAAKQVFEAALRISKRSIVKRSQAHSKFVVPTALEISDDKYEELLTLYNLREQSI